MKSFSKKLAALALASFSSLGFAAPGTIDTGTVAMGLFDNGGLGGTGTGLTSIFRPAGDNDAIMPGCLCEGWGAGHTGGSGYSYGGGSSGLTSSLLTILDADGADLSAQSVVLMSNGLQVTHTYTSAAGGRLFKVAIELKNTTAGTITDTRYSRTLDWDVPPGHFDDDFTTIYGGTPTGPGGNVLHTSTNPFAVPDPFVTRDWSPDTNVVDATGDLGAYFILGFGDLAADATVNFETYIGAGRNTADLLDAFADVGIEAYSYSYDNDGEVTYGWGFANIGLPPVFGTPEPGALALAGLALLGMGAARRRKAA